MKQVTQKRDTSRRRARLIGASLFAVKPTLGYVALANTHRELRKQGSSLPETYAEIGRQAVPADNPYAKFFKFLGRRSSKTLLALGLIPVGLNALTGAVLGRGVQHSYRRSRSQYPSSSRLRAVGAGITKGPFASPLIAVRDVRRRLFGKQYGLGGV